MLLVLLTARVASAQLLVAAAADLANLEKPLADLLERDAGEKLRFTLGSSGLLARQIGNGAPYDVFLSANELFVKELAEKGAIRPETVVLYATGRLGLWARDRSLVLEGLARAAVRHVAIPNPVHAPYGVAARQALERRGLWKSLEKKIVYGENVRQTLQYAESGNADAAITAWSLVLDRGGILLPDSWHSPIRQSGGVTARCRNVALAVRFLKLLCSSEGRKILEKGGFSSVPETAR